MSAKPILIPAALAAMFALAACDKKPDVVAVPAPPSAVVVPGPPGAPGEAGKPGTTNIIVAPAASAASN